MSQNRHTTNTPRKPLRTIAPHTTHVLGGTMRTRTTAAALLLLSLTACGTEADSTPKKATTAASPAAPDPDDAFINTALSAGFTGWTSTAPTEYELQPFPSQWCSELQQGHSVDYLFTTAGLYPFGPDWGTKKPDAHKLLLMAVETHCPDVRDQVTAELRSTGEF
ncbi:hypothetical protein [Streptomyces sp. NPDC005953]|uniref:hypothetical protein n=1 Tax=Streptomyces sp. NPDC005953 TaxID=3156719 RepID=UPI0033E0A8D3